MGKPGACSDPHVQDGMLENYGAWAFLTSSTSKPALISQSEQGKSHASSSHRKPQTGGARDQVLEGTSQKQDLPT